eukprot:TRINITY_DN7627_c0_g1_i1.p1 TRINITY_DN7627_c0_g1~~TRINITY_DN7627_c0_g1_i1.p1  ORF type:complete len:425 (-),score=158.00 TRINITY_DN7627_c0_g1_i1:30-1304(-)
MMGENAKIFKLEADEELRIEVDCGKTDRVVVELKSGHAEIFGTEMVVNTKYQFTTGAKIAVFTFQGCAVQVQGKMEVDPYTSKETPMMMYLNTHAALEQLRLKAEKDSARGPICMLVGPTDVGKSTVCRLLLNYAVRLGRRPIFADLDVGQGSIAVPGSVGAMLVERPASVEEGFSQNSPLVYHYGHKTPGHNPILYNQLVSRLADVVRERLAVNRKAEVSGVVINTCGWIRGEGYNQIKHIAQAFEVDVIIVLDQERVYNDLVRDMPKFVKVVWQPKSGGVVSRNQEQRAESRDARVKQYFYGPHNNLFPHSFEVSFSEVKDKLFKIGAPELPDSCLPLGMKISDNKTKLVSVNPNPRDLLNHVLAVSFTSATEDVIITNVAGFVVVTDIKMDEQKLVVLSPQPRPLPDTLLLLSEVQYVDST